MPVPFLDLKSQYETLKEETNRAVAEVFASQHFINGPAVGAFEAAMEEFLGSPNAVGVASGTDALLLALRTADIGPGDEVITTPFTFFATASAVVHAGATPVFVDIDPETMTIDPSAVEKAISSRVKAIIPVHLFGHCADMDAIMAIAEAHKLTVIEDTAQALGARRGDKHAGAIGDLGALSFFPSKILGGAGEGGMVMTSDENLAKRLRMFRNQGDAGGYDHVVLGGNHRLDTVQAAVLGVKLPHLPGWIEQRREIAAYYSERLSALDGVTTPVERDGYFHCYNYYVIRVANRDGVLQALRDKGIGCSVYYPAPLHLQEALAHLGYTFGDFPESEQAADEVLALPIYPELTRAQLDEVVAGIVEYLEQ
jgi:dTDP-4-amino-4,6-dideoxygalactose transaminase